MAIIMDTTLNLSYYRIYMWEKYVHKVIKK